MGIREQLSNRPKLAVGLAIAVVAVALALVYNSLFGSKLYLVNTYFSDNDGQGFFGGRLENVVPFQKRSTPAYRAIVYSCEPGGGNRFVGYLMRSRDQDLTAIEKAKEGVAAASAKYPFNDPHVATATDALNGAYKAASENAEVKRPGASNHWVSVKIATGQDVVNNVKCPGGDAGSPHVVLP
jgi:hypothetical protein